MSTGVVVGWLVAAGEFEQVGDEGLEPGDLAGDRVTAPGSFVEVVAAAVEDAGGGGEGLQRGAQFVADVGGEAAVAFDPGGQLVDHGLNEVVSRGEFRVGGGSEPGGEVTGGDLLRAAFGDVGQRPQHPAAAVAADRGAGGGRGRRRRG